VSTVQLAKLEPADVPIACFVGFVQYDLGLAVRAFAVARRSLPDALLILVGPRNREAEQLIAELGLSGAVHSTGTLPFARVPVPMGAADVLLLPCSNTLTNRARGPIKLGDYLAAGRAVLANPVGDLVDVFQADEVGVLAPDDEQGYGTALADLLNDRDRHRPHGAYGAQGGRREVRLEACVREAGRCVSAGDGVSGRRLTNSCLGMNLGTGTMMRRQRRTDVPRTRPTNCLT